MTALHSTGPGGRRRGWWGHRAVLRLAPRPPRGRRHRRRSLPRARRVLGRRRDAGTADRGLVRRGAAAAARRGGGAGGAPAYAAELAADSGCDPGLRDTGTLVVAHDSGDHAELERFAGYAQGLGLPLQPLSGRQCRAARADARARRPRRPAGRRPQRPQPRDRRRAARRVRPRRRGARRPHGDGAGARRGRGGRRRASTTAPACRPAPSCSRPAPGRPCWPGCHPTPCRRFGRCAARSCGWRPRRTTARPAASSPARCAARSPGCHVYLVPREDGEVVVGATTEEAGCDTAATAGGVLGAAARRPAAAPRASPSCRSSRPGAGCGPCTPDNAPLVGPQHRGRAACSRPATAATASCSPRSPATPWPTSSSTAPSRRAGTILTDRFHRHRHRSDVHGVMRVRLNGERARPARRRGPGRRRRRGHQAPSGVAVALNGTVVPRAQWSATPLADGDRVEVLTAVQGG